MNCIVTAGPTYESLDQVRRLTNFSTGKLGSELARFLLESGHKVLLLKGYYSVYQEHVSSCQVATFTTTADLGAQLQALAGTEIQAVFHAAAVSDFTFGRVFAQTPAGQLEPIAAGKLSTRQGVLMAELVPTPKLIAKLRAWFPEAFLAGWKFEVDGSRDDAVQAGLQQLQRCQTNTCVVNGPAYGEGFGLVSSTGKVEHAPHSAALFTRLGEVLLEHSKKESNCDA